MSRTTNRDTPSRPHQETPATSSVPVPAVAQAGPVSHAIFRVARLHRMIAGQLLRPLGLHLGQELVMMHLWELGPQRQTDLVRLLDSDAATMTRSIKRLENAGFVRRRPSPDDKRATIIEPTAASQALRREVERIWAELEGASTDDLTPDQQAEALHTLQRIEDSLARAATRSPEAAPAPATDADTTTD
ncbi:MarR family transcriptional regulator [Streptomyces sp. SID8375]|uniref:MarR family winged helix-turn-helix transcriptional regulator n=1 Tax=Streptomyces TaxID=1883 RepID=UPI0006865361|nr:MULTISPECIES: MarR family winged helix-turn-helix transcriptional regulator [Streptomyces]MCX5444536.1 MarR family winged helix-turn-helix transcriptional regulator [Streptomyces libani]MYX07814.1 MarR family transcriptional regulator [Streptomyces sp. SID8375]